jgi:hypothetical protein
MQKIALTRWLLVAALVCLAGPVGCGKKGSTVTGKIVLPADIKLDKTDSGNVRFVPTERALKGKGGGGSLKIDDQSFEAKDLAPGEYKIEVTLQAYPGQENKKRAEVYEAFNKKFDGENTKLKYTVTSDPQQSITIDTVKETVSK